MVTPRRNLNGGRVMFDNELKLIHHEFGELKQDLININAECELEDKESYVLATKIDLTVSRLLRLLECP
jgi:hypothetical protein